VPGTDDMRLSLQYQQLLFDIEHLGKPEDQPASCLDVKGTLCADLGMKGCFADEAVIHTQSCFIRNPHDEPPATNNTKYHGFCRVFVTNYGSVLERVISSPQIVCHVWGHQILSNPDADARIHVKGEFESPLCHQALLLKMMREIIGSGTGLGGWPVAAAGNSVPNILPEECLALAVAKTAVQVLFACVKRAA
jgi:hypothetical protein